MLEITRADRDRLSHLVPLFDQYRVFYGMDSDPKAAGKFLENRLSKQDSVIFIAYSQGVPAGFTQLFKSFSSVSLQAVYIVNDLYVSQNFRNKGIGEAILRRAQAHCREKAFKGLALETATDNPAQKLYERLGWKKDVHCFHYFWEAW